VIQVTGDAYQRALAAHRVGDLETAEAIYREILASSPNHAGAAHFLGMIHLARGQHEEALGWIERSLRLRGDKAVYWNNYGAVLKKMGRLAEAHSAFSKAVMLRADYPDAWSNLGLVYLEQGQLDEAERCLRYALRLQPRHADALRHLARVAQAKGDAAEAVRLCRESLAVAPEQAETLMQLGEIYCSAKRFQEAGEIFRRVVAVRPQWAEARLNLGLVYTDLEEFEAAREQFKIAAALRPGKTTWQLRELSLCPVVFDSAEAVLQFRAELERRLDEALVDPPRLDWRQAFRDGFVPSFHLYHHGVCNRALREKFARLFSKFFPQERPQPARRTKLRVGFLVTEGHQGGFVRGLGQVMAKLDRQCFEVVGLVSAGIRAACQKMAAGADITWVGFPHEIQHAFRTIRQAECDIIFHWQSGTDIVNYFLAFLPLAPWQCIGFGQHGTTGIATIDYFISSRLFERGESAREDYTEQLVQFRGLTTWQPRPQPPPEGSRRRWGLPEKGTLYFCPHRLNKFHPGFDPLLREILAEHSGGYLLVLEGSRPATVQRLQARWAKTLGEALCRRIIWLPSQPVPEYYRLLRVVDVVLDSPAYSSSLTGLDALALGVPVVTLPGPLMVQRYMHGFYTLLGISELMARLPHDYVALAVRLGNDPDFRQAMGEKIRERAGVLFEDDRVVREYEEFFIQLREQAL
jgi:predicted O-linked N-acetylglucosamine transferase (SPINDLY family)